MMSLVRTWAASLLVLAGCTPPATPQNGTGTTLSPPIAHQECRDGDAAACFALAYDYRLRGESSNAEHAMEAGRKLVSGTRPATRSAVSAAPEADPPKAAAPNEDRRRLEAEREQKAFEAWVASPRPPLARLLKPIEMAETFALDAEFYRKHGIHTLDLGSAGGSGARDFCARFGFVLLQECAMLLNKLNNDRAKADRRFADWAARAGLDIPDGLRGEQNDLSMRWTGVIRRLRDDLASEMNKR